MQQQLQINKKALLVVSSGFYDYIMQNLNDVKTRLQPADPK